MIAPEVTLRRIDKAVFHHGYSEGGFAALGGSAGVTVPRG
jgi:hypothetical protein